MIQSRFARWVLLFSFALFSCPVFAGTVVVIEDVNVVDVEKTKIVAHRDVWIENGKIVSIEAHAKGAVPGGTRLIDGRDRYLTPGLIDMHVHLDLWHYGERADDWSLPLYIANGVTTVRDAAGSKLVLAMREDVRKGKRVGPRIITATPFLSSSDVEPGSNVFSAKTPKEAREQIAEFFDEGYDYVKTNLDVYPEVFDAAAEFAYKNYSYIMGHPLLGKTSGGWWAVDYNRIFQDYRTVEHSRWFLGDYFQATSSPYYHTKSSGRLFWYSLAYPDFTRLPKFLSEMRSHHLPLTPTLTPVEITGRAMAVAKEVLDLGIEGFRKHPIYRYLPDTVYDDWVEIVKTWGTDASGEPELRAAFENEKRILREMDRAGLPILVGSDVPARPTMAHGFAIHDEMRQLQAAGVSSWGILRGATFSAAEALGMDNRLGMIRRGYVADLVLTDENPVHDVRVLADPSFVIAGGAVYSRKAMGALLGEVRREVRGAYAEESAVESGSDLLWIADRAFALRLRRVRSGRQRFG